MQKYILDRLRFDQPLSYSQMLPKDIESSQFMYHLRSLLSQGFVQKESRGVYSLTHEGKAALEYMSVNRLTPVRLPKVVTYTLLTHKGHMLLLRKPKEPYRNLIEPIAGKIHFGEDPPVAAQREVLEKLGLKIGQPMFVGTADMLITKDGKTLTHMTVYAHRLELDVMPSPLPDNAIVVKPGLLSIGDCAPGAPEIINAILSSVKKPFTISIRASADKIM